MHVLAIFTIALPLLNKPILWISIGMRSTCSGILHLFRYGMERFTERVRWISASFATFEPCESHAMHRKVAAPVVGLSHRPG